MRARVLAAAALVLAGCGEKRGDFNGRVEGSVEGPLAGESWYCEDPRGAVLVMEDPRRGAVVAFRGAPGAIRPGAWLLRTQPIQGGFGTTAMLERYPDPDAGRLNVHVSGGTLTIDAVQGGIASGRYRAETVTVDTLPTLHPNGSVGRLPSRAGVLIGFFKAVKRECPATLPGRAAASP